MSYWDYAALGCILLMVIVSCLLAVVGLIYWIYKKIIIKG